jgi:hypothetical protein
LPLGERTWYPDEAAYVAGTVLTVDGGAFIQGPAWAGGESHGEETERASATWG